MTAALIVLTTVAFGVVGMFVGGWISDRKHNDPIGDFFWAVGGIIVGLLVGVVVGSVVMT